LFAGVVANGIAGLELKTKKRGSLMTAAPGQGLSQSHITFAGKPIAQWLASQQTSKHGYFAM
jgi:hypothetical protein